MPDDQLDPRKQMILRAVVIEYVDAAEPVGSELLAEQYDLGVRSATIRNELAEISDLGYLEQPHTSAGRIPSDKGYRFYVDHLMEQRWPKTEHRQKVKSAAERSEALQSILQATTQSLSRMTQLISAAAFVQGRNLKVRNALVTALGPDRALLIIVLSNGHVENRMLEVPPELTLTDLGQANEAIQSLVDGKTLTQVARQKPPAPSGKPAFEKFFANVVSMVRTVARDLTRGKLIVNGEEYMLALPEFLKGGPELGHLLASLEDGETLYDALYDGSPEPQTVSIGKEHRQEALQRFTLIRQKFFVGEEEAGILGLIGPTRMRYEDNVPLLQYASKAISETLTKLLR